MPHVTVCMLKHIKVVVSFCDVRVKVAKLRVSVHCYDDDDKAKNKVRNSNNVHPTERLLRSHAKMNKNQIGSC